MRETLAAKKRSHGDASWQHLRGSAWWCRHFSFPELERPRIRIEGLAETWSIGVRRLPTSGNSGLCTGVALYHTGPTHHTLQTPYYTR